MQPADLSANPVEGEFEENVAETGNAEKKRSRSSTLHLRESRNLFEEAQEMIEVSSMMFFLGKMRVLAEKGGLGGSDKFGTGIMKMPVTADDMLETALESRRELMELEGTVNYGKVKGVERVDLHEQIIESIQLRYETTPENEQWRIVEYNDISSDVDLVYAIIVDSARKRVIVAFRGSVSKEDWKANFGVLPVSVKNPVAVSVTGVLGHNRDSHPEELLVHRGFTNYVFKSARSHDHSESEEADFSKYETIIRKTVNVLRENLGHELYVTGISLGGALANVFAFHAAASDNRYIPKPVICVNFGSPKVGTLSFRRAFQSLEDIGHLNCLRVANESDPVVLMPRSPGAFCDGPAGILLNSLLYQKLSYRHVGMELKLSTKGGYSIWHPEVPTERVFGNILLADLKAGHVRTLLCCRLLLCCALGRRKATKFREFHGYPEYLCRLNVNRKELEEENLSTLYQARQDGKKDQVQMTYL